MVQKRAMPSTRAPFSFWRGAGRRLEVQRLRRVQRRFDCATQAGGVGGRCASEAGLVQSDACYQPRRCDVLLAFVWLFPVPNMRLVRTESSPQERQSKHLHIRLKTTSTTALRGSDSDSSDATVDEEAEVAAVVAAQAQRGEGVPVLLARMEQAETQAAALKGRPSKLRALVEGGVCANMVDGGPGELKPALLDKGRAQVLKALQAARVGALVGEPYATAAATAIEATCRVGVSSAAGYRSKVC